MATLEQILGPTLAAQARLKPPPDDIRGHVLAKINKWVPPEADIETWLLENVKIAPVVPPPAPSLAVREPRIEVECTESGTETGSARYSVSYTATGRISMPESQLRDLIREAGNRADAIAAFEEWADDRHNADSRECGDYDYDDHESSDCETDERGHNARSVIEAYLDEHPELLEEDEETPIEVAPPTPVEDTNPNTMPF